MYAFPALVGTPWQSLISYSTSRDLARDMDCSHPFEREPRSSVSRLASLPALGRTPELLTKGLAVDQEQIMGGAFGPCCL